MTRLLAAALACLLLAGCSGTADDGSATPGPGDGALGNQTALPEPLHWQADIVAGADPFNFLPTGPGPCSQDVSSCEFYDFTVETAVNLTATLAWGVPANDLDLYLYQGTTQLSSDGINNVDPTNPSSVQPATSQVLRHALAPGSYTFWVAVWNGAADSYTLDVAFA